MRTILLAGLLLLAPVPLRAGQVCDGSLRDPARQRDIPVRVRMPEGASGPAPTLRRRAAKPTRPKPAIISAQVAGSGIPGVATAS